MGGFVDTLFGGGEPDNSGVNDAARANAALSKEALDWTKQRYAEEAPARQKAIDLATKTAEQQIQIADQNAAISKDYYDYQKGTFRPLEQGIVTAAEGYDTTARREQKAGQAVAGVNTQIDNARTAMRERMAARGVDLSGGNMIAQEAAMAVQGGAAAAAAANKAREDVELQGYARKMDAANLGRGLASSQATSAGVALNAGNSGVANAQVPVNIGNQATAGVQSGIQQAIGGNQSSGNLYGTAASIDATSHDAAATGRAPFTATSCCDVSNAANCPDGSRPSAWIWPDCLQIAYRRTSNQQQKQRRRQISSLNDCRAMIFLGRPPGSRTRHQRIMSPLL